MRKSWLYLATRSVRESECENLFVTFALSASHTAFSSIRMEPVFMVLAESAVRAGAVVATVKIIPLGVAGTVIEKCIVAAGQGAVLGLLPFAEKRAALIVSEQPGDPHKNSTQAMPRLYPRRVLRSASPHRGC